MSRESPTLDELHGVGAEAADAEADATLSTDQEVGDAPRRIRLQRTRGWRMPPNTVKVDRSTRWGNPFTEIPGARTRSEAAECFEAQVLVHGFWFWPAGQRHTIDEVRANLHGMNLACWCSLDQPCHADVLLEIAND